MDLKQVIRTVDNFPTPGVKFLDVTSILEDPAIFRKTVKKFEKIAAKNLIESIVAVDARGFIWAGAVAASLCIPLYLARKPGKLPGQIITKEYTTEYSTATLSMLKDVDIQGPVMIIDDILATGGTLGAVGELLTENWNIKKQDQIHAVLINLSFLPGYQKLTNTGYQVEFIDQF
jgi:adenine phosphoribosyltransferase